MLATSRALEHGGLLTFLRTAPSQPLYSYIDRVSAVSIAVPHLNNRQRTALSHLKAYRTCCPQPRASLRRRRRCCSPSLLALKAYLEKP